MLTNNTFFNFFISQPKCFFFSRFSVKPGWFNKVISFQPFYDLRTRVSLDRTDRCDRLSHDLRRDLYIQKVVVREFFRQLYVRQISPSTSLHRASLWRITYHFNARLVMNITWQWLHFYPYRKVGLVRKCSSNMELIIYVDVAPLSENADIEGTCWEN